MDDSSGGIRAETHWMIRRREGDRTLSLISALSLPRLAVGVMLDESEKRRHTYGHVSRCSRNGEIV